MRKFVFGVILASLMASISSAQEADTSVTQTEKTEAPEAAAVETVKKECLNNKWVLGFEATSLDLKDLPGTVFLQRKISSKIFMGAGFSFYYDYDVPGESYDAEDSSRYNYESKQWTVSLRPEIGYMALKVRDFNGGLSVKASFRRLHAYAYREQRYETQNYMYSTSMDEYDQFDYGINIPIFVEKQFMIKKYPVAIGMINDFLTVSSGWHRYHSRDTYESAWSPILDVYENESTTKQPVYFNMYNPFQGYTRLYFKFYL